MNAATGQLLMTAIIPIIQNTVPQVVSPVGVDDYQELIQDAIVSACQMSDSLEKAGKGINPNSVAFYSVQRTKSGRRSYSGRRTDALSPATILDGNSAPYSMEVPLNTQEGGDELTMGDTLADHRDDPGMTVARAIDWENFHKGLSQKHHRLLTGLANGERPKELAKKLRVSAPRITQLKREIGHELKKFMGNDILAESIRPTSWQRDIRMNQEKAACRADR